MLKYLLSSIKHLLLVFPIFLLTSLPGCMSSDGSDEGVGAGVVGIILLFIGGKIMIMPAMVGNVIFFGFAMILLVVGIILIIA